MPGFFCLMHAHRLGSAVGIFVGKLCLRVDGFCAMFSMFTGGAKAGICPPPAIQSVYRFFLP